MEIARASSAIQPWPSRAMASSCGKPESANSSAISIARSVSSKADSARSKSLAAAILQTSDGRLTLSVPIQIKRRSGRKLVTLPNGETAPVRPWDVAPTSIQLALARGHRWLAMLESGEAKSLKEIATREGIDNSYVSRMVNLTTLAPDIVAAILDDTLPNHITLFDLAVDPPALWDEQRARVGL